MKIKIIAEAPSKLPKELQSKWSKSLTKVKADSDKSAIIFLAELLELLTGEKTTFQCAGVVDYDMFGACDYQWTLTSGKSRIVRQLQRDISESWQRVEVEADNVITHGLEKYKFKWNGECGGTLSTLEVDLEVENSHFMVKLEEIGNKLYEDFELKILG